MLNWGPHGAARARAQERGIGRASIEVGTTTDSYELQFVEPLAAYADLVAVGAENGLPLAHLVFAVGGPELTPVQAPEGLTYPLRVRLVALDAREHAVAHLDTTVTFRLRRPVDRHEYLIGRVDLPLPAGRWSWRAALAHGVTGAVLPRDTVLVVGAGPSLSVSDLALGLREASAIWQPAAGDTVYLTPFNLFRQRSEPTLYYEVSGAASGGLYRHQIAIFRMKGDPPEPERRPVVTLGFEEKADQSLIRAHRVLQLQRLRPGIYLLEVRVRGPDGVEGARRRVFRVGKER
jgi:hypothetical protein